MAKVDFRIGNVTVRFFSTICDFFIYVIDLLIRNVFFVYLVCIGIIHKLIMTNEPALSGFLLLYTISAIIWGLLLIKFVLVGSKTFGKSRYDLFFMGLLLVTLFSSLFSSSDQVTIFGSNGTWSYSILAFISISMLYYTSVLVFSYPRGVKWLLLGFITSLFVGGIIHSWWVIRETPVIQRSFITYATYSFPLLIASFYTFRKVFIKIAIFIILLLTLFLISYYYQDIRFEIFTLSLALFLLTLFFYLLFWIRNIKLISFFITQLYRKLFDRSKGSNKKIRSMEKKGRNLILIGILFACITLSFGILTNLLYTDLHLDVLQDIRDDIRRVEGVSRWLIGDNDLNLPFSTAESMNVLANYGIIALITYILLFVSILIYNGRKLISNIKKLHWERIVFFTGIIFVTLNLLINFMLRRFDAVTISLFVIIAVLSGIQHSISTYESTYRLLSCREITGKRAFIVRILAVFILIILVLLGILGLVHAVDKNLF